jgi:hypothetical protein
MKAGAAVLFEQPVGLNDGGANGQRGPLVAVKKDLCTGERGPALKDIVGVLYRPGMAFDLIESGQSGLRTG